MLTHLILRIFFTKKAVILLLILPEIASLLITLIAISNYTSKDRKKTMLQHDIVGNLLLSGVDNNKQ